MAILSLPNEITDLLAIKLDVCEDFVRFGAVCKSWQSSARRTKRRRRFAPWLMLVATNNDDKQKFFSLSSNHVFKLEFFHTKERKCWGSAFGWLVSFGIDMKLLLVNPFSRLTLPLPPQSTFQHQFREDKSWHVTPEQNLHGFVNKCILSAPPTSHVCVVLAINGEFRRLSFSRPGDEAWISIESSRFCYVDAIFYQGQFYAVRWDGSVSLIDISCPQPIAIDFASPPEGTDCAKIRAVVSLETKFYLVEISGYLCFVARVWCRTSVRYPQIGTLRFKVHKFNFHTRKWIRVKDLGNHAVFLGANTSFAVLASDFPDCSRPNCIYFNDYYHHYDTPVCDMGVYDLRTKKVEGTYVRTSTLSQISHPIYIMPSF